MEIRTRFSIGDQVFAFNYLTEEPEKVTIMTVATMHFMNDDKLVEQIDYIAINEAGNTICFGEEDAYADMKEYKSKNIES